MMINESVTERQKQKYFWEFLEKLFNSGNWGDSPLLFITTLYSFNI